MSPALHERARAMCARVAVRAWEYRQRHHAGGVWYRLRRVLADAARAHLVAAAVVEELERQGYVPLPVGRELEPRRSWFIVEPARLPRTVDLGPPVRPRLDARLLAAEGVVLVRFSDLDELDGADESQLP